MSDSDDAAFDLESSTVARAFDRASARYEAAAELQARVRAELLGRLDELKPPRDARAVIDLGAGTGAATAALRDRFRKATVVAVDLAPGMLRESARHQRLFRRFDRVLATAAELPFADASLDVAYSNLMLQWFVDPAVVFAELARALRPGGLLVFSTFGPETLRELRDAWESADPGGVHVNRFIDVHDLGGALQRTGFTEPVLDVDRHRVHHADAADLLRGLKAIGAHNVNAGRARALTGRRRYQAMIDAYERSRTPKGLPATWEIVYGIAWAAESTARRGPRDAHGNADRCRNVAEQAASAASVMRARSVFVAGTDTGVGKTHVAVRLIRTFVKEGLRVAGMKPVAAGATSHPEGLRNDDAVALIGASNVDVPYSMVNPVCLPLATSPHLAARAAGVTIDPEFLAARFHELAHSADVVVVEGAGGWLAPIGESRGGVGRRCRTSPSRSACRCCSSSACASAASITRC